MDIVRLLDLLQYSCIDMCDVVRWKTPAQFWAKFDVSSQDQVTGDRQPLYKQPKADPTPTNFLAVVISLGALPGDVGSSAARTP